MVCGTKLGLRDDECFGIMNELNLSKFINVFGDDECFGMMKLGITCTMFGGRDVQWLRKRIECQRYPIAVANKIRDEGLLLVIHCLGLLLVPSVILSKLDAITHTNKPGIQYHSFGEIGCPMYVHSLSTFLAFKSEKCMQSNALIRQSKLSKNA